MAFLLSRWDLGGTEKLPSYVRIVFGSVFETLEEIEQEMRPGGRSEIVQVVVDEVSPKNCCCQVYLLRLKKNIMICI